MKSHRFECGVHETISRVVLKNQVLQSFPEHYRLGFRILTGAERRERVQETIQTFLTENKLDFTRDVEQKEQDFASVLNLCGWDGEISLEQDFWTFIMVLLYLGKYTDMRPYK